MNHWYALPDFAIKHHRANPLGGMAAGANVVADISSKYESLFEKIRRD